MRVDTTRVRERHPLSRRPELVGDGGLGLIRTMKKITRSLAGLEQGTCATVPNGVKLAVLDIRERGALQKQAEPGKAYPSVRQILLKLTSGWGTGEAVFQRDRAGVKCASEHSKQLVMESLGQELDAIWCRSSSG